MNKLIIIIPLLLIIFQSGFSQFNETKSGIFNATIYCTPQFYIKNPPGTPIHIGNYFSPNVETTYYIEFLYDRLTWLLVGPRFKGMQWMEYDIVQIQPNNSIDNEVSIVTKWQVISHNYNYNNFTGQLSLPGVRLKVNPGGTTNCDDGIAEFNVRAVELTINAGAPPGPRVFWVTLKASTTL